MGWDAKIIYEKIQYTSPIKKNVYHDNDKTSIEHYYFIIAVNTKNNDFIPNKQEIHVDIHRLSYYYFVFSSSIEC
jgi:hypothetical protein